MSPRFKTHFKRKQHIETQPLFIKQEIIEISQDCINRQGDEISAPFFFETYAFNRIHNVKYGKTVPLAFLKTSPVVNIKKFIFSALKFVKPVVESALQQP